MNEQFYKMQPVLVSNDKNTWHQTYFLGYRMNKYRALKMSDIHLTWRYCKPDHTFHSIINWWKHDGTETKIEVSEADVLVVLKHDGTKSFHSNQESVSLNSMVDRYAYLSLPRFIDQEF